MERKTMKNEIRYSANAKRELRKWCRLIGGAGYKDFSVILKRLKMEKAEVILKTTKNQEIMILCKIDSGDDSILESKIIELGVRTITVKYIKDENEVERVYNCYFTNRILDLDLTEFKIRQQKSRFYSQIVRGISTIFRVEISQYGFSNIKILFLFFNTEKYDGFVDDLMKYRLELENILIQELYKKPCIRRKNIEEVKEKIEKLMIPNTKRGAYNMLVSVDNSTIIAETIYIVPC